jgi:ADP-ribose pyrophosphatase
MNDSYKLNKLTDCKWVNLFEVRFKRKTHARPASGGQAEKSWVMCSRKEKPIEDAAKADAVVIVPTIETDEGIRLVVTKEFRVPIWDFEYGFPAGLIDDGENMEQTVARELKEETGLELAKIKHVSAPVFSSAGLTDESCQAYLNMAAG